MIKFIHRYKQSIGVVFLFIAFCFAISGVGLDILHGGSTPNNDAITVNGSAISVNDIARSERGIESRYRQLFGDRYESFARNLNLNLRQQAVDTLIDQAVLNQEAARQGFAASGDSVREYLLTNVFKDTEGDYSYSPEAYRNLLRSLGMSSTMFEKEIEQEIARTTLVGLLRDAAVASSKDAESLLKRQKTRFSVVAATVAASDLAPSMPAPSKESLKKFYEQHATEYELPAQVAYAYYIRSPKDFEGQVQVSPQDVDFYYSENIAKYTLPEKTHIRSIKLLYPKENDPTKMAAVKERAKEAHAEASAGKPFAELVTKYSDDLPAKLRGGDRGWVTREELPEAFQKAVADTPVGAVSEIIPTDYGFEILKVEEKRPAEPRPLAEVRASIEKEIRAQEAPAYASSSARELLLRSKKGGNTLSEVLLPGHNLQHTAGLLDQSKDPEPSLTGLTQNVFRLPTSERLQPALIELGDSTVLVQVTEFKEPSTPTYEEVESKVKAAFLAEESSRAAATRADDLLKAAQANPANFDGDARTRSARVVGPFEISREAPSPEQFPSLTSQMRAGILSADKANSIVGRVYSGKGEFTILKVVDVKVPNLSDSSTMSELSKLKAQASQDLAQNFVTSTLEALKVNSSITVDPSVMGQ